MAITFDAVSGAMAAAVSSLTFSHTPAAGAVLVVFAAKDGDATTVTGVTFKAVALTSLLAVNDSSSGVVAKNSCWMLHNPASGAGNIVVTFSAAGGSMGAAHGLSYLGVVGTSVAAGHRTMYHAGEGFGSGAVDITVVDSVSGDMVVASCSQYNGAGLISAGATFTSRRFDTNMLGGGYALGTQDKLATGANTVVTFTNDDYFTTNMAFALIPSAAAGGSILTEMVHHHG